MAVTNRYLQGNFAPVTEEVTVVDLPVTGALPPALAGRYVRSGPNPLDADPANHHWFVGDGMLHGIELGDGRARWYRNRWVTTSRTAAHKGIAPVTGPMGEFEGSGNTNVVHHAGRIFAINELSMPYEVSPELETLRRVDFGGPLPAGMTAHPKFDPVTGEMHVMAYHFVEPYLRYHVIDAGGRLVRTEEIAVGGPVMVHDMGLTETRVVVLDLPVVFDVELAMSGRQLPYRWDETYQARVGLLPRGTSAAGAAALEGNSAAGAAALEGNSAAGAAAPVWIDIDPCYVFHPLNAYDDGERVVIDVVRYDTVFSIDRDGPGGVPQTFDRWTIDPRAGKVLTERLDDRPQEFPRGDERLATRRHRYGYATGGLLEQFEGATGDPGNAILKHDLVAGTTTAAPLGPGRVGGEFVFVPAADDAGEDDGWLVGYVFDAGRGASDFVVLDAHDFGTEVARVELPVRVPAGFHGNWIPDRALG